MTGGGWLSVVTVSGRQASAKQWGMTKRPLHFKLPPVSFGFFRYIFLAFFSIAQSLLYPDPATKTSNTSTFTVHHKIQETMC